MALLFIDSFDHYDTLTEKWNASNAHASVVASVGRNGTYACSLTGVSGTNGYIQKNLSTAHATVIVGAGFSFTGNPLAYTASQNGILAVRDDITSHVVVEVTPIGRLRVRNGDGTILATGTTDLYAGTYYFIELKVFISATLGTVSLRINEVVEASATNVDTLNTATATANNILFSSAVETVTLSLYVDDVYLANGATGEITDFAGDCRVEALFPNGAGAVTQWTPLSGANWQNVDEVPPDDDVTYVSTGVAGNIDTYTMTDLTPTTGTVKGVQTNLDARKDDAGTRTLAPLFRIGGVNFAGTSVNIGTAYAMYRQVYELSPASGIAWTIAEVNAAEAGPKLVA